MSIADAIVAGIRVAKTNMGDLVSKTTLTTVTSVYDTTQGKNVESTSDVEVEYVFDKFSWVERQAEGFVQTDVKVLVFNPNNDLEIDTNSRMTINEVVHHVRTVTPSYVGGYKPVITLVLRR